MNYLIIKVFNTALKVLPNLGSIANLQFDKLPQACI